MNKLSNWKTVINRTLIDSVIQKSNRSICVYLTKIYMGVMFLHFMNEALIVRRKKKSLCLHLFAEALAHMLLRKLLQTGQLCTVQQNESFLKKFIYFFTHYI